MSSAMDRALAFLHRTGWVTLPGSPTVWSNTLRWLFVVLMVLVGLLAATGLVAIPAAAAAGVEITVFTILGVLSVYAMLAVGTTLLFWGYRKQNVFRSIERQNVTLAARGITLRGVGPIPWTDFGPAEHRMVPAERSDGYVRRAVMPLTASGLAVVNEKLPRQLRDRISPSAGP